MLLALLLAGQMVTGVPSAALAPADPLAVSNSAQLWLWAQSSWALGAPRRDMAGGRFQALAGLGRWGVGVRAETMGMPGEFNKDRPETFRAAQFHVAAHRNLIATRTGGITIGPAAAVGSAVSLEQKDGLSPVLPKSMTLGVGARAAGPGWWAYTLVGQHQALKGAAVMATVHVTLSDRMAWVGDFAVGAGGRYTTSFGIAVRAF